MKYIKLTQNKRAIIDDEDYHYLNRFKWSYSKTKSGIFISTQISKKTIYIQEIILPNKRNYYLKHINDNSLDNRKNNLELISINHRRHLGLRKQLGASQYRGVQRVSKNTWRVMIAKDKIRYFLGTFKLNEEKKAGLVYNKRAKELYGEYAYQNKI